MGIEQVPLSYLYNHITVSVYINFISTSTKGNVSICSISFLNLSWDIPFLLFLTTQENEANDCCVSVQTYSLLFIYQMNFLLNLISGVLITKQLACCTFQTSFMYYISFMSGECRNVFCFWFVLVVSHWNHVFWETVKKLNITLQFTVNQPFINETYWILK